MPCLPIDVELRRFERGELDPATFDHVAHVRVGFAVVRSAPFDQALARFASALRLLAERAGRPDKFHMTVTVGYLALIARRVAEQPARDWSEFAAANPELFDRDCLRRWYDPSELATPLARATFLLPERQPPLAITSSKREPPP
jgi:hypothetical protein